MRGVVRRPSHVSIRLPYSGAVGVYAQFRNSERNSSTFAAQIAHCCAAACARETWRKWWPIQHPSSKISVQRHGRNRYHNAKIRMPITRQQRVYSFKIRPVLSELVCNSYRSVPSSRRDRRIVKINVCFNIAPDLGQPESDDHRATIHDSFLSRFVVTRGALEFLRNQRAPALDIMRIGPADFSHLGN